MEPVEWPRVLLCFLPVFYAFRTPFQRVIDKSFSHPADRPLEALKTAGFYPSKCVGRCAILLLSSFLNSESISLLRKVLLAINSVDFTKVSIHLYTEMSWEQFGPF